MTKQKQLPKFDKIWKALDHCVKNNEFTQIKRYFTDGECGRCVNGVIVSYFNGYDFDNLEASEKLPLITNNKILYIGGSGYYHKFLGIEPTKENVLELLKEMHEKKGYIDAEILADLNNGYGRHAPWTFEDFRDLFKELDV